jgi:predicted acylesterase/phospholipase RssA
MTFHPARALAALALVVTLTSGCASPTRLPAVPETEADAALVPGMPASIRTWGDEVSDEFLAELGRALSKRSAEGLERDKAEQHPDIDFLAISGGGASGAFGAGLLCGWTASGERPVFELVTGISTGALTAPYAFLGSAYDAKLQELYTTVRTKDVLCERGVVNGILGDALTSSAPLRRLVRRHLGADVMAGVAQAYGEGRILLVGTTNLDAQRGVLWNMGAIAASGHPRALELFQDVLIASASIPAAFPPVMLRVDVGGRPHEEMHVDGGTLNQVFVYPPSLRLESDRRRHLYVIRNGRLDPQWESVERGTLPIASRAIDSMIAAQGSGDLYRIFLTARRDQLVFSLAHIPATFRDKPSELFDRVWMSALFDVGYAQGLSGGGWLDHPPGFAPPTDTKP